MSVIYCIKCIKFRKPSAPKISYIFGKIQVLSIIGSKCGNNNEKIFKEEESIEILKVLSLIG